MRFVPDFLLVYLYGLTAFRVVLHCRQGSTRSAHFDEKEFPAAFLDKPIAAGVVVLLCLHFVAKLVYVPTRSMLDTLQVRDVLFVDSLHYRLASPVRGEIAVFYQPGPNRWRATLLVKRIVALDGDKFGIHHGRVYINDQAQTEPYVADAPPSVPVKGRPDPQRTGSENQADFADHRVAPHCFFALGDNRTNSVDSRAYGDVPLGNLVGLVRTRVWPPSRVALF